MKYMIKGDVEVKIGGSGLLPHLCDFHIGATLTDETLELAIGQGPPLRIKTSTLPQLLSTATKLKWWDKYL